MKNFKSCQLNDVRIERIETEQLFELIEEDIRRQPVKEFNSKDSILVKTKPLLFVNRLFYT